MSANCHPPTTTIEPTWKAVKCDFHANDQRLCGKTFLGAKMFGKKAMASALAVVATVRQLGTGS